MKLDAGIIETFYKINRPCKGISYEAILSGLRSLEKVTLQTMFVAGNIQNTDDWDVKCWIERVSEIRPLKAQIYSLHRPPAEVHLQEVPIEILQGIAIQTQKMTGILVEVVVASSDYRPANR